MTNEPSPRPWRVNGHTIEANDPDGLWLQNEKTGWGVVANLPSCPKSRMSAKNRKTWDAIVEANAALIVAAVNERAELEAAHMKFPDLRPVIIAAGQRDAAIAERDRLRDIVRRIESEMERCHRRDGGISQELMDAVYEARAAIGEDVTQ